jgi:hypothetical protein
VTALSAAVPRHEQGVWMGPGVVVPQPAPTEMHYIQSGQGHALSSNPPSFHTAAPRAGETANPFLSKEEKALPEIRVQAGEYLPPQIHIQPPSVASQELPGLTVAVLASGRNHSNSANSEGEPRGEKELLEMERELDGLAEKGREGRWRSSFGSQAVLENEKMMNRVSTTHSDGNGERWESPGSWVADQRRRFSGL